MAIIQRNLGKLILFAIVFIELNIIDAQLTDIALVLGSSEVNPILGANCGNCGSNILFKATIAFTVGLIILLCKKGKYLRYLNLGMTGVVIWNIFVIWSWL